MCTFEWVNNNPQILWCRINSNVDQGIIFYNENQWKMWEIRKLCGGSQIVEKSVTAEGIPYDSSNPFYVTTFPTAFTWDSIELGLTNLTSPDLYFILINEVSIIGFETNMNTYLPVRGITTFEVGTGSQVKKVRAFNCQPNYCFATVFL